MLCRSAHRTPTYAWNISSEACANDPGNLGNRAGEGHPIIRRSRGGSQTGHRASKMRPGKMLRKHIRNLSKLGSLFPLTFGAVPGRMQAAAFARAERSDAERCRMTATEDTMDAPHGAPPMCVSLMRSDASPPPMPISKISVDQLLHVLRGGSGAGRGGGRARGAHHPGRPPH